DNKMNPKVGAGQRTRSEFTHADAAGAGDVDSERWNVVAELTAARACCGDRVALARARGPALPHPHPAPRWLNSCAWQQNGPQGMAIYKIPYFLNTSLSLAPSSSSCFVLFSPRAFWSAPCTTCSTSSLGT